MSSQRTTSESKALVPAKQDVLAVVSVRKSKRPFTVVEVEALVQVVGKLGTGRWRSVKLRAFDNAKHRTYVDLKLSVLVHTSQRRGEPGPQELLDRVLTAHAYWSRHQPKQHSQTLACFYRSWAPFVDETGHDMTRHVSLGV
ncbi:telomere repeat-binding protein 5-like [Salvia hispanica]|uniref:telomere repeat-binding protein 5-like n=1 Tax=Salvia hispanica TaxID=49212 RepID=UPI00200921CA|nr:telomere repeat-binding protein 5-like [Salvia hispanica]